MSVTYPETFETIVRPKKSPTKKKDRQSRSQQSSPKQPPRYNVILWDDPVHTYDYVIEMMQKIFRHSELDAFKIAEEVDLRGRAICCTTSKEVAELKRDQIHGYGSDPYASIKCGSMAASIEPAPGE